jgi:hypothetical protein
VGDNTGGGQQNLSASIQKQLAECKIPYQYSMSLKPHRRTRG